MINDMSYSGPRQKTSGRWRLLLGIVLSLGAVALAYLNRAWLLEALSLVRSTDLRWLALAFGLILTSFFISSQVFQVVLRSLGYHMSPLRLWGIAIVAIVTSQSFPAGGVGSYAFLLNTFNRRGVSSSDSALVAALEALSYAGAMLLFASFGLAYLASEALSVNSTGLPLAEPLLAGAVALIVIGAAVFILSRPATTLTHWLRPFHGGASRVLRREIDPAWMAKAADEVVRARDLMVSRKRLLALLLLIQMAALSGHSLALYIILHSLGAPAGFGAVVAAFGIALLTGTFNVLPGGGGTVETLLVVTLTQFGAGAAAVPAAILFRLLNFWVMLPVAGAFYLWLGRNPIRAPEPQVIEPSE